MERRKKRSLSAIVFAQSINLSELRATQREKKIGQAQSRNRTFQWHSAKMSKLGILRKFENLFHHMHIIKSSCLAI